MAGSHLCNLFDVLSNFTFLRIHPIKIAKINLYSLIFSVYNRAMRSFNKIGDRGSVDVQTAMGGLIFVAVLAGAYGVHREIVNGTLQDSLRAVADFSGDLNARSQQKTFHLDGKVDMPVAVAPQPQPTVADSTEKFFAELRAHAAILSPAEQECLRLYEALRAVQGLQEKTATPLSAVTDLQTQVAGCIAQTSSSKPK